MYLFYCIIASFASAAVYEYSGMNKIGIGNLFLTFLLITFINLVISNPKKHYKRNIMIFSFIMTMLSIFNAIKVRFQLSEITFFDVTLAKAAGGVAGLFLDKLPYGQIFTILAVYILEIVFSFKYELIFEQIKLKKEIAKQNEFEDKLQYIEDLFSNKIFRIMPIFMLAFFVTFSTPISNKLTSSFGNLIISAKAFFTTYAESLKPYDGEFPELFQKIEQDPLSKKDENDPLLKDYPFDPLKNVDVIVFQSETFFDLPKYQDKLGENGIKIKDDEITTNFEHYQKEGVSGKLYTPVVGGGTVNTEYEMMTGYSVKYYPQGTIVFTSTLKDKTNSLAWYMKNVVGNTKTIAVHNHTKEYWERDRVYPLLGFDEFIYMDMFTKQQQEDLVGAWMSDKTIFDMTKKQLEKNKGKNLFLLPVTVQNHGPFLGCKGNVEIENLTEYDGYEIRNYVANLKYSDQQLKEFMDYLDSREKPTIMIFYGDHKPDPRYDIFKTSKYYTENDMQNLYYTDYFVYFNKAVDNPKLLALKGKENDLSAPALSRFIQMILGDSSKESMYIYNYAKDPKNYFNKRCLQGLEDSPYRQISLNFVNKYLDYNSIK